MATGRNALHIVLQESNLLEYEPLLLEEGADDLNQLKELDEEEFQQLCLMVGMAAKPFHVKRLQKALNRPSTHLYMHKRAHAPPQEPTKLPPHPHPGSFPKRSGVTGLPPSIINPQLTPPSSSPSSSASSSSPRPRIPSSSALTSAPSHLPQTPSPLAAQHHHQQQNPHQQHNHQHNHQQPHQQTFSAAFNSGALSPERDSNLSINQSGLSKQFFLPPCLRPGSDLRDIGPLIDETTPVQAELGVCPFAPSDWDIKRAELVRRHSAIYGQNTKRKNEELSMHEENINEAAFQLCLRDPTLLVRRDELLILSRRAIKEGGYTFQHGMSKAKVPEAPSFAGHKRPLEKLAFEESFGKRYEVGGSSVSLPRNLSREKKLKRVEELEFIIGKNKLKQSLKLAALEKARQGNDFSTIYHLQAEIESLGNTLAGLQEEYSNMKYRLRRSDRYFERKRERNGEEQSGIPQDTPPPRLPVAPKRPYIQDSANNMQQLMGDKPGPSNHHPPPLLPPPHSAPHGIHLPPGASQNAAGIQHMVTSPVTSSTQSLPMKNIVRDQPVKSENNSVPSSSHSTAPCPPVTSTACSSPSPLTHPPLPTSSPSPSSAPSTTHQDISEDLAPIFPQHHPQSNLSNPYLNNRPTVTARVLPQKDSAQPEGQQQSQQGQQQLGVPEENVPSDQLLANINKLATQAAANLRSIPHF